MATSTAISAAKDIVVAWLGRTEVKGTDELVANHIAHVLETVANKIDELSKSGSKSGPR